MTASSGDGGSATSAVMAYPKGVAIDAQDVVYIAEFQGEKIRQISNKGIISTVAGAGTTVSLESRRYDMMSQNVDTGGEGGGLPALLSEIWHGLLRRKVKQRLFTSQSHFYHFFSVWK